LKIKILLIIFLPFKKQNALRARLRPLKESGCPDSPSIVPEVGEELCLPRVHGRIVSPTGQGVSSTSSIYKYLRNAETFARLMHLNVVEAGTWRFLIELTMQMHYPSDMVQAFSLRV